MKALVLGSAGQVGVTLLAASWPLGVFVKGLARADLDITDRETVRRVIDTHSPDVVVNAAAYTAVDRAEREPMAAIAANRDGAGHVAEACARAGAALIHLSTDYVFGGENRRPYDENAATAPLGVYGRSKAEGEAMVRAHASRHIILRTAWVYGVTGRNFVKTILELTETQAEIRIVTDHCGSPTWASDLAEAIITLTGRIGAGPVAWGTYHFAGLGEARRYDFAKRIVALAAPYGVRQPRIVPVATADQPEAAARPPFSALDCRRIASTFGITPRPWQEALAQMLARYFATPHRREG